MDLESKSYTLNSTPQVFWVNGMPIKAQRIKVPVANAQLREKIIKLAMDCHNKYSSRSGQFELSSSSNYVKVKVLGGSTFEGRVTSIPMKDLALTNLYLLTQPTVSDDFSEIAEQNECVISLSRIENIEDSQIPADDDSDFCNSLNAVFDQMDEDITAMKAKDFKSKI